MESLWTIITIAGPIAFIAVVLWVYISNKRAKSPELDAKAERGARKVRQDIREHGGDK